MKKCLVVIDYQNDFVTGSLGFAAAEAIGPAIAERIKKARAEGEDVIFTLDTHGTDYLGSHEGRLLPVPHCIMGTAGWDIASPVAAEVRDEDRRFQKDTFGSKDLFTHLAAEGYDQVELCGLVADICVSTNAALARTALPQADIIVDSTLTASADPDKYQAALEILRSLQIDVRSQDSAG